MCVPMAMAFVERAIHHSPEWKTQNTPIHCRRRPDGATNSKLSQHTHTANNTLCSRSHSLWCDVLCCASPMAAINYNYEPIPVYYSLFYLVFSVRSFFDLMGPIPIARFNQIPQYQFIMVGWSVVCWKRNSFRVILQIWRKTMKNEGIKIRKISLIEKNIIRRSVKVCFQHTTCEL